MRQYRKSNKGISKHLKLIYYHPSGDEAQDVLMGVLPEKKITFFGDGQLINLDERRAEELEGEVVSYAWERLLNYLTIRERAVAECRSYLYNLPLNQDFAEKLIERAKSYNYIDDKRFAELLTGSYINRKKSKMELKTALFAKRIEPDIIEKTVDEVYDKESKREVISHQVEKGIRKYPDKSSYKDYQKCIAFLIRKGFRYDDFRNELDSYYKETESDVYET